MANDANRTAARLARKLREMDRKLEEVEKELEKTKKDAEIPETPKPSMAPR